MEEGIEQLEIGIARAPDFFLLYEDLARSYADSFGRNDKAAKVMSDLMRRDTDSRTGMNALAKYWLAVDDRLRAKAWNDKLLEQAPTDSEAKEIRIALLQKEGDLEAALAIAETLPAQGFSRVGRSLRFLELCVTNGDRACAVEHLESLAQFLTNFEARLGGEMTGIRALLDYFRGRLQYPDEAGAREALERSASTIARFTVLSSGSPDLDSRRYFLAEILTMP